jgi:hypothetical protein
MMGQSNVRGDVEAHLHIEGNFWRDPKGWTLARSLSYNGNTLGNPLPDRMEETTEPGVPITKGSLSWFI